MVDDSAPSLAVEEIEVVICDEAEYLEDSVGGRAEACHLEHLCCQLPIFGMECRININYFAINPDEWLGRACERHGFCMEDKDPMVGVAQGIDFAPLLTFVQMQISGSCPSSAKGRKATGWLHNAR